MRVQYVAAGYGKVRLTEAGYSIEVLESVCIVPKLKC
jgi:hypothetical protein